MLVRTAIFLLLGVFCATAAADTVLPDELAAPVETFDAAVESLLVDSATAIDPVGVESQGSTSETYLSTVPELGVIKIPDSAVLPPPRTPMGDVEVYQGDASLQGVLPDGAATPVPLPGAAWAGLALIGVIGLAKQCRRQLHLS